MKNISKIPTSSILADSAKTIRKRDIRIATYLLENVLEVLYRYKINIEDGLGDSLDYRLYLDVFPWGQRFAKMQTKIGLLMNAM
ncbi:hypothetical protein NQ318_004958 [Aromia moschata]|uniref:Uncharacterized protein n=1 Tax=Aromia moschata TaxID=1265417 RepID=A0AAV8XAM2_9CUCU|nr:hypothetical protein NQ318_004958 [Aromia moschata]